MKRDVAIEEIRKTRYQISEKFSHDTRAIISHYRKLESKYAHRILMESTVKYLSK